MRWPWQVLFRKREKTEDEEKKEETGNGEGDPGDFPDEYKQHGMKAKGERAQQLHRHDSTSKLCFDDMDDKIKKLKTIKIKLKSRSKNGKPRVACKEEG